MEARHRSIPIYLIRKICFKHAYNFIILPLIHLHNTKTKRTNFSITFPLKSSSLPNTCLPVQSTHHPNFCSFSSYGTASLCHAQRYTGNIKLNKTTLAIINSNLIRKVYPFDIHLTVYLNHAIAY